MESCGMKFVFKLDNGFVERKCRKVFGQKSYEMAPRVRGLVDIIWNDVEVCLHEWHKDAEKLNELNWKLTCEAARLSDRAKSLSDGDVSESVETLEVSEACLIVSEAIREKKYRRIPVCVN